MEIIAIIATLIISAIVFIPLGVLIRKRIAESKVEGAEGEAKRILDLAKKEAEKISVGVAGKQKQKAKDKGIVLTTAMLRRWRAIRA